jgi:hypothetical protein
MPTSRPIKTEEIKVAFYSMQNDCTKSTVVVIYSDVAFRSGLLCKISQLDSSFQFRNTVPVSSPDHQDFFVSQKQYLLRP